LLSSAFVPKGRVDFQSFRMRSLRLRVTRHGNKDMWLSELTAQWFNFQRLRSKASPIHPSFPFEPCARFFHTFSGIKKGLTMNDETEKINSFEMAKKQVDIAAQYLDLDPGSIEKLKNTKLLESEELLRPRDSGDSIHN